jgi:hypothetical protein
MITRTYPSSTDLAVRVVACLLALALTLAFPVRVGAQNPPAAAPAAATESGPTFKQEELDAMLAPIALYPDALLSQV